MEAERGRDREIERDKGIKGEKNRGRERQKEAEIKMDPEVSRAGEAKRGVGGEALRTWRREAQRDCARPQGRQVPGVPQLSLQGTGWQWFL